MLGAALLLAMSFFGLWLGLVNHTNTRTAMETAQTLPPEWAVWRERWQWGHAGSFVLQLGALCLLLALPGRFRREASLTEVFNRVL